MRKCDIPHPRDTHLRQQYKEMLATSGLSFAMFYWGVGIPNMALAHFSCLGDML